MPGLRGPCCRNDTTVGPGGAPPDDALNPAADAFERLRPRLLGIAYRVLGSAARSARARREACVGPSLPEPGAPASIRGWARGAARRWSRPCRWSWSG
jgi:hypothetical protein